MAKQKAAAPKGRGLRVKVPDVLEQLGPDEDAARGMEERLNVRLRPWMISEVKRIAELEQKSVSNMARHMLEVGLKWYTLRHDKKS
jgi:hypothetical protein